MLTHFTFGARTVPILDILHALSYVCGYLEKNSDRMRYDEYLRRGYPIASGVIEGACRHLVKDRMERSGMRWTLEGARSMLHARPKNRFDDLKQVYLVGGGVRPRCLITNLPLVPGELAWGEFSHLKTFRQIAFCGAPLS